MIDRGRLDIELDVLCRQIDQEYDLKRKGDLAAAYCALQWARDPLGFARPSECFASPFNRPYPEVVGTSNVVPIKRSDR